MTVATAPPLSTLAGINCRRLGSYRQKERHVAVAGTLSSLPRPVTYRLTRARVGKGSEPDDIVRAVLAVHAGDTLLSPTANSLTPAAVNALPDALRDVIVGACDEALTPVFLMLLPLVAVGFVVLLFVKEVPLRGSIEDDSETGDPVLARTTTGGIATVISEAAESTSPLRVERPTSTPRD
jgi:hypothetical protein